MWTQVTLLNVTMVGTEPLRVSKIFKKFKEKNCTSLNCFGVVLLTLNWPEHTHKVENCQQANVSKAHTFNSSRDVESLLEPYRRDEKVPKTHSYNLEVVLLYHNTSERSHW